MAEAKNAATINRLMSKRPSVLYFHKSTLFSRVKGHKGSPVLPRLLPSIVMGSLLRRAHFESLRAAEAKNSATINQLKYRSRSCITENIALGVWSRANKALGCASCFIGSRPRPRAIFPVMHSHGTLTSIKLTLSSPSGTTFLNRVIVPSTYALVYIFCLTPYAFYWAEFAVKFGMKNTYVTSPFNVVL